MTFWMWFWLVAGQISNILRQAAMVAGSHPDKNPINSVPAYIYRNLIGLLVRTPIGIGVFLCLLFFPEIITYFHPAWTMKPLAPIVKEIPFLAWPGGIIADLAADMFIETQEWLKSRIPILT